MANKTVKSAAATSTAMSDVTKNPTINATVGNNRRVVHITLVVQGITLTAAQIYTALATLGTVASEKDTLRNNNWVFNVGP